ncbi:hypothetical protein L5515_012859 [Caenorhabditis briggsae]|uniref:Uncharacterized protein n=1 Tax=Caenorhabditis briggsae TaxID=6238 RepID=A0AAE9ETR0_CAEBR|nr:hypothetical protein L3Y34_005774 [Caenorhabditis briggsae]UMM31350.1 hypothetical protein L5515_012859 [Caenorhabditis briggsae]
MFSSYGPYTDYLSMCVVVIAEVILAVAAIYRAVNFVIPSKNIDRNDCRVIVIALAFENVYAYVAMFHSILMMRTEPMNLDCFGKYNMGIGGIVSILIGN